MRILKLYYFVGHKICSKVLILFPFYEPYPDSFLHCGNVFLFNMFCFLPFLSIGKLKRMLHYSDLLSFCLAETFFVQHVKTQRKIRLDFEKSNMTFRWVLVCCFLLFLSIGKLNTTLHNYTIFVLKGINLLLKNLFTLQENLF